MQSACLGYITKGVKKCKCFLLKQPRLQQGALSSHRGSAIRGFVGNEGWKSDVKRADDEKQSQIFESEKKLVLESRLVLKDCRRYKRIITSRILVFLFPLPVSYPVPSRKFIHAKFL